MRQPPSVLPKALRRAGKWPLKLSIVGRPANPRVALSKNLVAFRQRTWDEQLQRRARQRARAARKQAAA